MQVVIRDEKTEDVAHIHDVIVAAFEHAPHTDHNEQHIISALRQNNGLALSRVATVNNKVVGYVAISAVSITDKSTQWFGLGPVGVLPEYHHKGIGRLLIRSVLDSLKESGANGCVVLGDPNYYQHFGFKVYEGLIFEGVPPEYFQALPFSSAIAKGKVHYNAAFYSA